MFFWMAWFTVSVLTATLGSGEPRIVPMGEIFFIASQKELDIALRQEEQLRGLAVSINFYQKTSGHNRVRAGILIERRLLVRNRPVFVYGQPFDRNLAKQLLIKEDGEGCTPTVWAGLVIGELDGKESTVKMCGANNEKRKEKELRKDVLVYWETVREVFRTRGYKF